MMMTDDKASIMGGNAYCDGKPIEDCPFDDFTIEWFAWRLGYYTVMSFEIMAGSYGG